jgi:hypothetical protein
MNLSGSFTHAALYALLLLQVGEHLFPGQRLFDLPPDKRRIVDMETGNLLLQFRWRVESRAFAGSPDPNSEPAPAGTVLGSRPSVPDPPGCYR